MYIKQSKNSFIRCTDNYGYITNQLTKHDRVYDSYGSDILSCIKREPVQLDEIVQNLLGLYEGVSSEELRRDVYEFCRSLSEAQFIVMSDSVEELDEKDNLFSYTTTKNFHISENYYQQTEEKINQNTQDFFLEEVQGRPLISNLQFELSSLCNERCIHCYIPNDKKNKGFNMPLKKVKDLIDEFAGMGGLHVTLSGGEVFLFPHLKEVVTYCREKDLKISILSNLILLKDDFIPWLKEANLSVIQVSLYSMNPEIHDLITTVKGSWEKTKTAIEKLVDADIPIQISCPLMKANKDSYGAVLDYAKKLNVKAQTDYILMARSDLDTSNLANRLSLEETAIVIKDIIEKDKQYQEETLNQIPPSEEFKFDPEKFKQQPVCGVGYDNCCVTASGDVYPCAGWQDYVLGNVYKNTLKEIWENSERVKDLRKITQASFPQCLECEAANFCNRCLVRNYNESGGNMFAVHHHFCDVAFLNKRLVEEAFGNCNDGIDRIIKQKVPDKNDY